MVRTDFKTRYHGTIGGFVWALFKPMAMFVVLMGVFSFVFPNDPNYRLNLVTGLFFYDFFSDATTTGLMSLRAKAHLLTKVQFPPWIVVVASISNATITLLLFLGLALGFLLAMGRPLTPLSVALLVWYQLHYFAIVIGFCLAMSVLFLQFRDLNQVWDVVTQAGFFVAPIIYPLSVIPERLHFYLYLWPPTPIILFSRSVLVEGVVPSFRAHVYLSVEALVALGAGALVYRRYGRRAAEYL